MTSVKFCKDCLYSKSKKGSAWILKCYNPIVNRNDEWALSSADISGTSCREERAKKIFAQCGMSGKLWESKV